MSLRRRRGWAGGVDVSAAIRRVSSSDSTGGTVDGSVFRSDDVILRGTLFTRLGSTDSSQENNISPEEEITYTR